MNLKSLVPNSLTAANLVCGILAINAVLISDWPSVVMLVLLAAFFDFFDGFAARMLKVGSELGGQLDSLADMVTFGVVPGFVIWKWLEQINESEYTWIAYVGLIIPIFSMYRLAKFNLDTRQTDSFIGLPTPANTLFLFSIPVIGIGVWNNYGLLSDFISSPFQQLCNNTWFVVISSLIFSFLLNAEIPLFALKFKSFGWKENQIRWLFLLIAILLLLLFAFMAIPIIILLYLIISIITNYLHK